MLTTLVADGLSSVTQALSTTGTVVATQLFAPYGAIRYSSGTMPTAYGFTGTRLNALGERFYDPVVGQFVNAGYQHMGTTFRCLWCPYAGRVILRLSAFCAQLQRVPDAISANGNEEDAKEEIAQ